MTSSITDIIDFLAGIEPGSALDGIRSRRPETRLNAQKSYLALFEPADESAVSRSERLALAAFVAALHGSASIAEFYAAGLAGGAGGASLVAAVTAESEKGRTNGPYGHYPAGPLSSENTEGLDFRVSDFGRSVLGARLSAVFEHAHLLVFRPREASPEALQRLLDAGWTTTGVVTVSQIVAFLAFQIRAVAGLKALSTATQGALAPHAAE